MDKTITFLKSLVLTIKLIVKAVLSNESYEGMPVVHDSKSMEIMGGVIAVMINVYGFKLILVDDSFVSMSVTSQEFIFAHEYGHTTDSQLSDENLEERVAKRLESVRKGYVVREEAFADDYAVERCGLAESISALEEVRELLPVFGRGEIDNRINRLKEGEI